MFLSPSFQKHSRLRNLANRNHAEFVDIQKDLTSQIKEGYFKLCTETRSELRTPRSVLRDINSAYVISSTSEEAITKMYDIEYEGSIANYRYSNALLSEEGFKLITGYSPEEANGLTLIDVGAGSNELLRFLRESIGIPPSQMHGSDISAASSRLIASDGFLAHLGRLESLGFVENQFDAVFLTYFVDYDTNQRETFKSAVSITKPGGKIILEGLLPCRPHGMLKNDNRSQYSVTRGRTAIEDIELIVEFCMEIAAVSGKTITLERLAVGSRYIYNRLGLNERPSFFIVMRLGE